VFIVLLVPASVYGIWYFRDADKAFCITLLSLALLPCLRPLQPQLACALAMASSTDLSKPSAPALLLRDNLSWIQVLLRKAQQTHTIMQQNLTWALPYNLIALLLAAVAMIPLGVLPLTCP
jgi:hypothetical protein